MCARLLVLTLVLFPLGASSLAAQAIGIREVTATARSVIPLDTKLRYTTMILLPDDEEILDVLSSNLCRCTGYQNIIKAVRSAAAEMRAAR